MRILHFLSRSSIGGGQVVVSSLMNAMKSVNTRLTLGVVLPQGGLYVQKFRDAGYETFTLSLDSPILSHVSVLKVIKRFSPDIIHTHERGAGYHVRNAVEADKHVKLFHSFHGFNSSQRFPLRHFLLNIENTLAKRTNSVICVSESEANNVHLDVPQARGKIHVIQNCIDAVQTRKDAKGPLPDELDAWIQRQATRKIITMIARPVPVKDHDLAFSSIDKVLSNRSQYAFLFVGLPPNDPRFQRLKRTHGDFCHAISEVQPAAPVIKKSWALLLTSKKEGSPLVVLEGFALGVPTIGARAPGVIDVLQDRWNGLLMDPVSNGLLSALNKIESDRSLYAQIRKGAKKQGDFLKIRTWARHYLDLYLAT